MKSLVILILIAQGTYLCAQEAYIREFTGQVEVKAPGADWTPAAIGLHISKNTLISTGFRSFASISLGNSTLIVRPLTRLSLEELRVILGNEEIDLYLQTGRVRVEVNPPAGNKTDFRIRSPTATASVRGTTFEFDGVNLQVEEGQVRMSGGDGTAVYIGAGHQVVSDTSTGKTQSAAESAKAGLIPVLPSAIAENIPESASSSPSASPLLTNRSDLDLTFNWNE
jgi:hypothetical protein